MIWQKKTSMYFWRLYLKCYNDDDNDNNNLQCVIQVAQNGQNINTVYLHHCKSAFSMIFYCPKMPTAIGVSFAGLKTAGNNA
jgi:hypothetical protein